MALYGLVAGGNIVETAPAVFPVHPNFAWTPDLSTVAPQPGIGWSAALANNVWSYTAPPAPVLTPAQQAQAAYTTFLRGGVAVTSASTAALNGTYPIDAQSQADITTEASFANTFAEFTSGGTTLQWQQSNGTWVTFPTIAAFLAFAKAVGQLVAAAKQASAQIAGGGSAMMPAGTVTIP